MLRYDRTNYSLSIEAELPYAIPRLKEGAGLPLCGLRLELQGIENGFYEAGGLIVPLFAMRLKRTIGQPSAL